MKTVTWKEIWPTERLLTTKQALDDATKRLAQAKLALERLDNEPSARCVAIQAQINEAARLHDAADSVEELILHQDELEQLERAHARAQQEHEDDLPARRATMEDELADLTLKLNEARVEFERTKVRVEMAHRHDAPGPIHSYRTMREAARAVCHVVIGKNHAGADYAEVEGVTLGITGCVPLTSMAPPALGWLQQLTPGPTPEIQPAARVVYIEETGEILIRKHADVPVRVEPDRSFHYAQVFGSLEEAIWPFVDEVNRLRSINVYTEKDLPTLGEAVRDAYRKTAAEGAAQPQFHPGQGRLREEQISKLIGAYWNAFIDAPWETSIAGSYALLKHRCARGESPHVFSYDTHGHFGFRIRTPDHDWITGEIYCPPEHFSPTHLSDLEVINHTGKTEWLAELGPVKFLVRRRTSRS